MKTIMTLLLLLILSPLSVLANAGAAAEEVLPAWAVLFPWFTEAVGLVVFFLLTRYIHVLPYTAVMFVLGVAMGVGATRSGLHDQLTESIGQWITIDHEVLLLVFLPGLVFRDAFNVNFHLFTISLGQILLFAFPMVLAGTTLTACVGFYVFPYEWSWNLSMTFGSILAATDPVAVAALLNEVGAPPRLKMHISGESMMNDGSAIVFFTIFSSKFLFELGVPGLGQDFGVAAGFEEFFKAALGGALTGVAFALGLLYVLWTLDRRLETENNVVQVAATVTVAYLSFYVAEIVGHMSGVIAVVMCGITTRAFGEGFINDPAMLESFWVLLEHLLNTLLFTLGGVVWGRVCADTQDTERFGGQDWGYLIVLYLLAMVIRFFLMFAFFPITSRIGLKSNWQETVFLSYGGLRGAVGIALAIALDNEVRAAVLHGDKGAAEAAEAIGYTNRLFGMVGGVALLTLVINGTTAGPLLKKLGLTKSTETRKRILEHYTRSFRKLMIKELALLLLDPRFDKTSYPSIRAHTHFLKDLEQEELDKAIAELQASNTKPEQEVRGLECDASSRNLTGAPESADKVPLAGGNAHEDDDVEQHGDHLNSTTVLPDNVPSFESLPWEQKKVVKELRLVFIELLSVAYERALETGFLDAREYNGFVYYALRQSLEFAADSVNRDEPLSDWTHLQALGHSIVDKGVDILKKLRVGRKRRHHKMKKMKAMRDVTQSAVVAPPHANTLEYQYMRMNALAAYAFQQAHRWAQEKLVSEFGSSEYAGEGKDFVLSAQVVVVESKREVQRAETFLKTIESSELDVIVSHYVNSILLNKAARYVELHARAGLLTEKEAHHHLEHIAHQLEDVHECSVNHTLDEEEEE